MKTADEKMERHREVMVERVMRTQCAMVEACHEFITAVIEMERVGLPHGAYDDGYFAECLQMARDYIKQHYDHEDDR